MDEWAKEMRRNGLWAPFRPWLLHEDAERSFPRADEHSDLDPRHFSSVTELHHHDHHHHHQPGGEDLFKTFLLSSRPQGRADDHGDVKDWWDPFRSRGGGSIDYTGDDNLFGNSTDSNHQFHGHEPARDDDMFADLMNSECQFYGYQLPGENDILPDLSWSHLGFDFRGNDLHEPNLFDDFCAGPGGGRGFYEHQPQSIDGAFGGNEPRPYGLLESPLFGDHIFNDHEPRPQALHREHYGDNRFGDIDPGRDRFQRHQRAIGWHHDTLRHNNGMVGHPWD